MISLAQDSSALVAVSHARFRCDPSDPAGGAVFADSDGGASAPEILRSFQANAAMEGWTIEPNDDVTVLRKTFDGRRVVVVAPGGGTEIEADSDSVTISWLLDREDC